MPGQSRICAAVMRPSRSAAVGLALTWALAAPPSAYAAQRILTVFDAGGSTHIAEYVKERTHLLGGVIEAVQHVFGVYQPLWSEIGGTKQPGAMGFRFYVVIADDPAPVPGLRAQAAIITPPELPPGVVAALPPEATQSTAQICRVNVYQSAVDAYLLWTLAHEIAHCYQSYYSRAAIFVSAIPMRWFTEGGADWMMLLAYPDMAQGAIGGAARFLQAHDKPLFDQEYDAVYFWQFMASPLGLGSAQAVVEFMRNLPANSQPGEIEAYLRAAVPDLDAVFHSYAVAIGRNQIPKQPKITSSTGNMHSIGSPPVEIPIAANPLGIRIYRLIFVPLGGLHFEAVGNDAAGLRASVVGPGGAVALRDGQPELFCPPSQLEMFVAVSATTTNAISGDARLRVTQAPENACEDAPPPNFGMTAVPGCLAGDWIVETIPDLTALLPYLEPAVAGQTSINQHTILFSLAGDGTYGVDFTMRGTTPQATTIIHARIAGHLVLQASTVRGNSYDITTANAAIVPGSASGMVQVGGIQVDVTPTLGVIFSDITYLLPRPEYLTCADDGTMLYVVVAEGVEQTWVMRRP